jgi:hypothetical protein
VGLDLLHYCVSGLHVVHRPESIETSSMGRQSALQVTGGGFMLRGVQERGRSGQMGPGSGAGATDSFQKRGDGLCISAAGVFVLSGC